MTTTKTFSVVIAPVAFCASENQAQVSPSTSTAGETRDYSVTCRGDHHREWERVEYETAPDGRQLLRVQAEIEPARTDSLLWLKSFLPDSFDHIGVKANSHQPSNAF